MSYKESDTNCNLNNEFNFDLDHLYELLNNCELAQLKLKKTATSTSFNKSIKILNRKRILFPKMLYNMLKEVNSMNSNIISWSYEGGLVIHDRDTFETDFLPKYFRQTKIRSFFRQLNIYGFKRIESGKYYGGYVNVLFDMGQPHLIDGIERIPIKQHLLL